ncbi:MAG TPA: hypothetical protein VLZ12_05790 [Verrucomicrobiae bacterium]|nr:hypothetical protein [Verrucomicrobiae bacterium]
MRKLLVIVLGFLSVVMLAEAIQEDRPAVTIGPDGMIVVADSAEIPPFSPAGHWVEGKEKSSDRHVTRHFLFQVPNEPPALELFVTRDLVEETPDDVFEIALINGYVSAFARGARFRSAAPVFEDCRIGSTKLRRCAVQLSNDSKSLWVFAYVYVRTPSLVFLTVRAEANARPGIERYLATVRLQ